MSMRQPGVEPGSTAWKATMLTVTPLTLGDKEQHARSLVIFHITRSIDCTYLCRCNGPVYW